jgi:hypothetical protein
MSVPALPLCQKHGLLNFKEVRKIAGKVDALGSELLSTSIQNLQIQVLRLLYIGGHLV